ncbi:uncharacterized protein BYT42DRAFT_606289 [Radiomyces spectabilis]|uniref:uncharacterized protein n=1 Tax=Radiomyces spectabilis TaxID=64574 RepID=UPI00221F4C68|nr:uncharacterized protein BYT42DRAFT_606289 [Radiomyces spectabilis]KAI8374360.1 hypothetical protein BYT42DRAFT_606289 [Radiomyces spectabilis]
MMQPPAHLKSRRQQKIWEQQQRENAAKRQKKESYVNQDPFRYAERHFKLRIPPPDMSKVIDLSNLENLSTIDKDTITEVTLSADLRSLTKQFGASDDQWHARARKAYILKTIPGLIVIPNPFTPKAQRSFVRHCVADYACPPNTSSLASQYDVPKDGIWPLYVRENAGELSATDISRWIPAKETKGSDDEGTQSNTKSFSSAAEVLRKQRWITLGYQYHWGTKEYDLQEEHAIPLDLSDLTKAVVTAVENVGGDGWTNAYQGCDFKSEAGVINYYQLRDTLMAHVDRSELNMDAPLVSISFGHACIYLIGGPTKDTAPVPLCLRSGDVVVMTGPSRKAYHGVPRILEDTLPSYLSPAALLDDDEDSDWSLFGQYMLTTRINLNVRQVFPKEQGSETKDLA